MTLVFTISLERLPIFSTIKDPRDGHVKEPFDSIFEYEVHKFGKTFVVSIETNCPTYVFLQKINSLRQYEIWTNEYLEECSKRHFPEYYDTPHILMDFIGSVRHGTFPNIFSIIELYRKVKKTNIESSTIELFQRLFSYLNNDGGKCLFYFYISDTMFYSLFEEKMVKIITFLYSKKAFLKADRILSALSKSKINKYRDTSKNKIFGDLMKIKNNNYYYFIFCVSKRYNENYGQIPIRHIYSFL